jgi:hypothetical protein
VIVEVEAPGAFRNFNNTPKLLVGFFNTCRICVAANYVFVLFNSSLLLNRECAVGIEMRLRAEGTKDIFQLMAAARMFLSPLNSARHCGPTSLLFGAYQVRLSQG